MNKIRIGYFADGPWSHKAFDLLVRDADIDIAFIVPRSDSTDLTLFNYSNAFSIPYYPGININSASFYELASDIKCDLFVSMSFNQIFKRQISTLPAMGTINCHAGKLPFYRGRNILNWALINDENEFGITVHYIDEGIDTGDIILQRTFPISDDDNYESLLEVSHKECASILYDAIKLLQAGKQSAVRQSDIHPVGFYCGQRLQGDEIINWNKSSRAIFNFIRAICSPGPKAQTTVNGNIVKINRAELIARAPQYISTTGQIVGKTGRGYVVKTEDTTLEIFDIESSLKLKIGDRLGT